MKRRFILSFSLFIYLVISVTCYADQDITARKVTHAPVIDGRGDEPVWAQAAEYTAYDNVANIPLTLRAIYTDTEVFFLVSFPDPDESVTHKTWVWDKDKGIYIQGADREDSFVFKWNMEPHPVDLSVKADNDYMADIWFWKARRSDPSGYADDKFQRYSSNEISKSMKVISKSGKTMYLRREGDDGTAASKDIIHGEYKGDGLPRFENAVPTGSRADVKAKGTWSNGRWTIEFARTLNTGNSDDIQFDVSKSYLFGISRYEIAAREPDPDLSQPLYGSGDVSEALTLQFME